MRAFALSDLGQQAARQTSKGVFWLYIAYEWSREINGFLNRAKHPPVVVLLVSLVTCGLGGLVFEVLFAADIVEQTAKRGIVDRRTNLQTWVIALNCTAFLLSIIPFAFIIAMPLGVWASAMIQQELNKLAEANLAKANRAGGNPFIEES